jgi:flavodoxin
MRRRSFIQSVATSFVSSSSLPRRGNGAPSVSTARGDVLLVFFSRAGENYFNGGRKDLTVGNTEVVAGMIRDALRCEVFQIKAVDPYPHSYDATVQRNVREQNDKARPRIANLPASLGAYRTILIGSPIWNVSAPRIMLTFAERYDFTGKTINPFTTYAMSGLGSVVDDYSAACRGAKLGEALAIRGEEAEGSRSEIDKWLRRIGLVHDRRPVPPREPSSR